MPSSSNEGGRRTDDPVEPLSEARWARIKESLFEKLDDEGLASPGALPHRRRSLRSGAAIFLAGAAAAAIGAISSHAMWRSPGQPSPSHIVTAASESHVLFGGASLDVGPRSELDVSGDDEHGVRVQLDRGHVLCAVAPRHGRPPFLVQAGEVLVRVVGTRFGVSRDDDGVEVDVDAGIVEVEDHGELHRVGAGEHWHTEPVALAAPSEAPVAEPPALATDAREVARATPAATPSSGRVASGVAGASRPERTPFFPRAASSQPQRSPQERYESAAALETREPAAALAIYEDLAQGDGPWSANALFAAGRLEADRGALPAAKQLLGQYLARFPHGANAADATDLVSQISHSQP